MGVRRLVLLSSLCCLSLACASTKEGDADSAAQGWRAASAAMQGAAGDFHAEVEPGDTDRIEVGCPGGGTLVLDGAASDASFDFTIAFDACTSQDIRIDGELSYSGENRSETGDESLSSAFEFEYVGELSFSGAVDLSCTIDVSGKTSTSIEGTNVQSEAELRGSICGHDAQAVASVGN